MSANNIKIRKITDLQLILIRRHYIMKLVPLADRVVLKQLEAETKTKTGIILTSSAQEKPQEAEVVAVGPGTDDVKMEVTVVHAVIHPAESSWHYADYHRKKDGLPNLKKDVSNLP